MILQNKNEMEERKIIIICTALCFIFMYILLNQTISNIYMPDDYLLSSEKMPTSFYMSQGRFIQGFINCFYNIIDVNIVSGSTLFTPIFLLTTSLVASTFVTKISKEETPFLIIILLSFCIVSHPVFAMMAVYHLATVCFSICMISIYFYMQLSEYDCNSRSQNILCILLVVLICGNYQPGLIVCVIYTLVHSKVKYGTLFNSSGFKRYLSLLIGLLIYLTIAVISKSVLSYNNWDTRLEPVDNIILRITEVLNFLPNLFYKEWWVIPKYLGLSYSFMLLAFLFPCIYKIKHLTKVVSISLVSLSLILAPIAIIKEWDPTPRAIFSIAFFYPAVALLSGSIEIKKIKIFILSLSILIGSLSTGKYLYNVDLDSKKDKEIISIVYNELSKLDHNREIYIYNNNAISVAPWAVKGLYYFYTKDIIDFKVFSSEKISPCNNKKQNISTLLDKDKIIFCLNG